MAGEGGDFVFLLDSSVPQILVGDWPAWIALCVSVLATPITVALNNLHARKMRELDIKEQAERSRVKAIQTYISETNAYLASPEQHSSSEACRAFGIVLAYFTEEQIEKASSINTAIQEGRWEDAQWNFSFFSKEAASLISPSTKPDKKQQSS